MVTQAGEMAGMSPDQEEKEPASRARVPGAAAGGADRSPVSASAGKGTAAAQSGLADAPAGGQSASIPGGGFLALTQEEYDMLLATRFKRAVVAGRVGRDGGSGAGPEAGTPHGLLTSILGINTAAPVAAQSATGTSLFGTPRGGTLTQGRLVGHRSVGAAGEQLLELIRNEHEVQRESTSASGGFRRSTDINTGDFIFSSATNALAGGAQTAPAAPISAQQYDTAIVEEQYAEQSAADSITDRVEQTQGFLGALERRVESFEGAAGERLAQLEDYAGVTGERLESLRMHLIASDAATGERFGLLEQHYSERAAALDEQYAALHEQYAALREQLKEVVSATKELLPPRGTAAAAADGARSATNLGVLNAGEAAGDWTTVRAARAPPKPSGAGDAVVSPPLSAQSIARSPITASAIDLGHGKGLDLSAQGGEQQSVPLKRGQPDAFTSIAALASVLDSEGSTGWGERRPVASGLLERRPVAPGFVSGFEPSYTTRVTPSNAAGGTGANTRAGTLMASGIGLLARSRPSGASGAGASSADPLEPMLVWPTTSVNAGGLDIFHPRGILEKVTATDNALVQSAKRFASKEMKENMVGVDAVTGIFNIDAGRRLVKEAYYFMQRSGGKLPEDFLMYFSPEALSRLQNHSDVTMKETDTHIEDFIGSEQERTYMRLVSYIARNGPSVRFTIERMGAMSLVPADTDPSQRNTRIIENVGAWFSGLMSNMLTCARYPDPALIEKKAFVDLLRDNARVPEVLFQAIRRESSCGLAVLDMPSDLFNLTSVRRVAESAVLQILTSQDTSSKDDLLAWFTVPSKRLETTAALRWSGVAARQPAPTQRAGGFRDFRRSGGKYICAHESFLGVLM